MERTIIALHGRAGEGKSETIKNVCRLLLETFPKAESSHNPVNYDGDILVTIQIGIVKIGLESQGDPNSRMIHGKTIRRLASSEDKILGNCDIILCATRTSGMTVNKVDEIANEFNFHTLWLSSYWSPTLDFRVLNRMAAESVIGIIKSLITMQF